MASVSHASHGRGAGVGMDAYLGVLESFQVGIQVELYPCRRPRQRHATDQQHNEHDEGKSSRDVHNLWRRERY